MAALLSVIGKRIMLRTLLSIVLALGPGQVGAVFSSGEQEAASAPPTRLVVRYRAGTVAFEGTRIRGTSTASVDQLGELRQRYKISGERPLLRNRSVRSSVGLSNLDRTYVISVAAGVNIEAIAESYRELDIVEYAQPDYPLELYEAPDDPLYAQQWGLNNVGQDHYEVDRYDGFGNDVLSTATGVADADIDALEVYESPPGALSTVVVGIVDTGVDPDHPDLAGAYWVNPHEVPGNGIDDDHNGVVDDVTGCDIDSGSGDPTDEHGHGTHCAGIVAAIAGNGIGVAGITPDARIMGVKCWPLTLVTAAEGIVYAVDNGADVINMSWGASWEIQVVRDALVYADSRGVVLVAAAGNDGELRNNYPASYPETISVAASTSADQVATFSTFSDNIDVCAPGMSILSLRAAGTDMYGTRGEPDVHIIADEYYLASGTSMAAPHVVGIAAYLRAISPGLSPGSIRDMVEATADDFVDPYGTGASLPGWDRYSGHGRVNLRATIDAGPPVVRAVLNSPERYAILSGVVDVLGSADGADFAEYRLDYGVGSMPTGWVEINQSSSPVTDGTLGSWNTAGLDGPYVLRLGVGNANWAYLPVYAVEGNLAAIASPLPNAIISGTVSIFGSAVCPDFDHTVVAFGRGTSPTYWTEIARTTAAVYEGPLCEWNCATLADGTYQLRVSVYSSAGLETTASVSVSLEAPFAGDDGWTVSLGGEPGPSPTYCDIDLDGSYEFIVGTTTGIVVVNTDGSLQTTGIPDLPVGDFRILPAVGRLDEDQYDEDIVFVRSDARLFGYPTAAAPFEIVLPELPMMSMFFMGNEHQAPRVFLRDIDGDGIDEIHYYPGGVGHDSEALPHFVYNADGTAWECGIPQNPVNIKCHPADLDGDGVDEMYCIGSELIQYDLCGSVVTSTTVEHQGYTLTSSSASLSAVDIDSDGKTELILHGAFNSSPWVWLGFYVYAFDEGLTLKEGWPHEMGINGFFAPSHPAFGDLDGDGSLEYVSAYSDLDYSFLFAWNLDGTPFLGASSSSGEFARYPNQGTTNWPMLADFNDDLRSDILVACGPDMPFPTPDYQYERVLGYDYLSNFVDQFPLMVGQTSKSGMIHNVMLNDMDQDGSVDLAYASVANTLVFQNFPGRQYHPSFVFCPMLYYNRTLDATAIFGNYTDVDGDGWDTGDDNCPYTYNPDQADGDADGIGDACECCVGRVGDANGIGGDEPTIGDISVMIDAKFITGRCDGILSCLDEADVNQSGGTAPTCDDITVGDISTLIDYLFITGSSLGLPDCL